MVNLGIPESLLVAKSAEMYINNNSTQFPINGSSQQHALRQFTAGELNGWSFDVGSTGAITAFADAGGGQVTVTSAGHTLSDGDVVSITGTTNYNGLFVVAGVAGNDFEITDTWVADDATGVFDKGDNLVCGFGSGGWYQIGAAISASAVGSNETFEYDVFINDVIQDKTHCRRKFSANDIGAMPLAGDIQVVPGDIITVTACNIGASGNLLNVFFNFNFHKIGD